jgi:hypothetical protein
MPHHTAGDVHLAPVTDSSKVEEFCVKVKPLLSIYSNTGAVYERSNITRQSVEVPKSSIEVMAVTDTRTTIEGMPCRRDYGGS